MQNNCMMKIETALKCIEDYGFHIKNRVYTDTYFLYDGDKNSICHFHIKEIPRIFVWNLGYL